MLVIWNIVQTVEAYSEVEENNIQNKELWAKAFAQCGGDKEKQKSIYVELRTKELSKGWLISEQKKLEFVYFKALFMCL